VCVSLSSFSLLIMYLLRDVCRQSLRQSAHSVRLATTLSSSSVTRSFSALSQSSTFLSGSNSAYIDSMFAQWKADPKSVHASWDAYFRTGNFVAPPTLASDVGPVTIGHAAGATSAVSPDAAKVLQLVRAFQVRGHLLANLDPLGLMPPRPDHDDLKLETYGFKESDLDKVIDISSIGEFLNMKGFLEKSKLKKNLSEQSSHQVANCIRTLRCP
jgi:2-oxoglutarate dehydrogenase E1 component